jgi:serine/threonine protein phosphatase 1
MRRTFVIGDIHGGLYALEDILAKACIDFSDKLIFLGDYVDGWSQSLQVIDFLIELNNTNDCIFIRGNHDQLLLNWLENDKDTINMSEWYKNGGESTVLSYRKASSETKSKHIAFLKSLHNYYLDQNNRLFIHAGFTNMNGVRYEYFPKLFYWDRTLWETALSLDVTIDIKSAFYPKRLTLYKEIYIGHTPLTRIGSTIPVNKACVWNIDTGAAFAGVLTIMNVDTKEYWQSEPLPYYYPNEKGRN